MLQLEVVSSSMPAVWLVEPVYTIGSGDNDIFIPERGLEEAHFQLQISNRYITLCELGPPILSVLINEQPFIGRGILKHGDVLVIGQSRIEVTDSQVNPLCNRKKNDLPCDISVHWRLMALSSALEGHTFVISHNAILGRDTQCHIVLRSIYVSKQQAQFVIKNNQLAIIDLDSSKGTFVNKRRIKQQFLKDGDHIMFGALPFKLAAPKKQLNQAPLNVDLNKTQLRVAIPANIPSSISSSKSVKTANQPTYNVEDTIIRIPSKKPSFFRSAMFWVVALITMTLALLVGLILYR